MWLGLIINSKLTSENDKTEKMMCSGLIINPDLTSENDKMEDNDVLRLHHQLEADIRKWQDGNY
jgi:hypothetical protein